MCGSGLVTRHVSIVVYIFLAAGALARCAARFGAAAVCSFAARLGSCSSSMRRKLLRSRGATWFDNIRLIYKFWTRALCYTTCT